MLLYTENRPPMHPKHDLIVEILELLEQEGITLRAEVLNVRKKLKIKAPNRVK
jgi:hypothetical protein